MSNNLINNYVSETEVYAINYDKDVKFSKTKIKLKNCSVGFIREGRERDTFEMSFNSNILKIII